MLEDAHVLLTKCTGRSMACGIALRGPVEHGVCTAVRHKRTVAATGQGLSAGTLKHAANDIPCEEFLERVLVDIAEAERAIVHFREHACLIGSVNVAVVVVSDTADSCSSRTLQVHVPAAERRQHFLQHDLPKSFFNSLAA